MKRFPTIALVGAFLLASAPSPALDGFVRGDPNGDGWVDLSDAVFIVLHLFEGKECGCLEAADIDASGAVNVSDPLGLLGYLYLAGPGPRAPFPACGAPAAIGVAPVLGCVHPSCNAAVDPGEPAWYLRPDGCRQCEGCPQKLEEVVADLEAAGIAVLESKRAWIPGIAVCAACGCPSGQAWWVLVLPEDVPALVELGEWRAADLTATR